MLDESLTLGAAQVARRFSWDGRVRALNGEDSRGDVKLRAPQAKHLL